MNLATLSNLGDCTDSLETLALLMLQRTLRRMEDFDKYDPIRWWVSRRTQFPDLYRLLACDILCIPGE